MIKSIFGHFPKHLLHRSSHNSLSLVHSFCKKKGLPSQKQSAEFIKKKEILDKQTSKKKEIVDELTQTQKEKEIVDELKQTSKQKETINQLKQSPKGKEIWDEIKKTSKQKEMGEEIKQPQNEKQYIVRELKQLLENEYKKETKILVEIQRKFYVWMSRISRIATIIASIFTVFAAYYAWKTYEFSRDHSNISKWAKARQQHLKDFEQNNSFVHGKSVENKIRSIFEKKQNYKTLELILGVEGIGKTSAAKQLITERRKKAKKEQREERIYFISLKNLQQQHQKMDEDIQKMSELIHAIGQQYNGSVPTTLVIDDINNLEDIQNKLDRIKRQVQIIKLSQRGVKVILISSSTGFYHNIWINERFKKYTNKRQHIIWTMSEQQSKQILQKKGKQLKIDQKIIQKVISFGVPLRDSIALFEEIVKWQLKQNKQVMEKLQSKYQGLKQSVDEKLDKVLHKIDKRTSYQIIKGLTKNQMHVDVETANKKNCLSLFKNVNKLQKQNMLPSLAIAELDKGNLIIMCYPRSRLIMKVFQEKLKELEKK